MKELGLSREQGIRLLEQARREPVPLREGLTEEEALALLEVFRRAGSLRMVFRACTPHQSNSTEEPIR